jgi:hypothetical protein
MTGSSTLAAQREFPHICGKHSMFSAVITCSPPNTATAYWFLGPTTAFLL